MSSGRPRAYVYGMTVLSTVHRLAGPYPPQDSYQEIERTWLIPGGEAGNAAILLACWGVTAHLAGPALGRVTAHPLTEALSQLGVECEGLHVDGSFDGYQDLVLMDGQTRTVFGWFEKLASDPVRRWSPPDPRRISEADIATVDPFLGADSVRAAEHCLAAATPYVTIDCAAESLLHRGAAATVLSGEYLRGQPGGDKPELVLRRYQNTSSGLCVVTAGSGVIRYGRGDASPRQLLPFRVREQGTLGAGDAFRAGIAYGVLANWTDERTVRFAAAASALVCARGPIATGPPTLEQILSFAERRSS